MSTPTEYRLPPRSAIGGSVRARRSRLARILWPAALIAAALFGGEAVLTALQSPGQAIRSELAAAAAELESPVGPQPTEAATRAIQRHFRSQAAAVSTEFWPQVSVTFKRLDRITCV